MLYFFFLFALVNGKDLKPAKLLQPATTNKTSASVLDKVVANPKQFVAEVQNLDPGSLRTIINLLEDLLTTSEERETTLNNAVSDAEGAVSDAANGVADAEDHLTNKQTDVTNAETDVSNANAALATAQQAEAEAQGSLNDAKADHTQKVSEREGAEANRDDEVDSLNHEQQVLRDVIEILEGLHQTSLGGALSLNNWETNGVEIADGKATCIGNQYSSWMKTKKTFSRPMVVTWNSRQLPGEGAECVVMDVFPQNNNRHSGYSMGYGWWAHNLGYGRDGAASGGADGDIFTTQEYKMELTDTEVIFYQNGNEYHRLTDSTYTSGVVRVGQSCRKWEVSSVTITEG